MVSGEPLPDRARLQGDCLRHNRDFDSWEVRLCGTAMAFYPIRPCLPAAAKPRAHLSKCNTD